MIIKPFTKLARVVFNPLSDSVPAVSKADFLFVIQHCKKYKHYAIIFLKAISQSDNLTIRKVFLWQLLLNLWDLRKKIF